MSYHKTLLMKKILTSLFFAAIFIFGFSKSSSAQGNLQFNQVILLDINFNTIQPIAVPAGKVWKIESTGSGSSSSNGVYLRNASATPIAFFSTMSASTSVYPYWLPSGFTGSFQNFSPSIRCTVSIIEFNVVP